MDSLFGFLEVLPILFFILIVVFLCIAGIASKIQTQKKKYKALVKKAPKNKVSANNTENTQRTELPVKSFRLLEDRENDWLARQRREEAANERHFSAMYGLKRSHEANCPAGRLKDEHRKNCDADSVDTGTVR
ncbi:MAG: hypothetical protein Q4E54_07760 [Lachnospiraceae bacterium]|nr:hypothetical protein [Lachnospiraceae bacterium]